MGLFRRGPKKPAKLTPPEAIDRIDDEVQFCNEGSVKIHVRHSSGDYTAGYIRGEIEKLWPHHDFNVYFDESDKDELNAEWKPKEKE